MGSNNFTMKELLIENRNDTKAILSDMAAVKEHLKTLNGRVGTTEKRVHSLQAWKWKQAGALVILSILATYIINKIL